MIVINNTVWSEIIARLTMAGEYLLVKEFLETHENVSEVWLMAGPDLLQTSIDATYSYS